MRKLKAFKRVLNKSDLSDDKVIWVETPLNKIKYYGIENNGEVRTNDGNMFLVNLRFCSDLKNPDQDVALRIGSVRSISTSGTLIATLPALWFWNDKFWLTATARDGVEYYNNKNNLFYEVEVDNKEEAFESMEF